ncbi:MAG: DUF3293 domain-containing protein [Myxococcota bacterium]
MREHGLHNLYDRPIPRARAEQDHDIDRGMKIADLYEALEHRPHDPRVWASYRQFVREIKAQFDAMRSIGQILVEPWRGGDGEPYRGSRDMIEDVTHNHHLWFLPTIAGFGEPHDDAHAGNPLLERTGIVIDGYELVVNDQFRAIHDYFGHADNGNRFGPVGEERAWREHVTMFTLLARPALTTETRGQSSWVNFGPHLRREGRVPRRGEEGWIHPAERPFAAQKTGLLPPQVSGVELHALPETGEIVAWPVPGWSASTIAAHDPKARPDSHQRPRRTARSQREELAAAYRSTRYEVSAPGLLIELSIGAHSPPLDALLASLGVDTWALVTAWNPRSIPLAAAHNHRRNHALRHIVRRWGLRVFEGRGRGEDPSWTPEASVFIPGITKQDALHLATLFEQNAIVFGRRTHAPQLVWCDENPEPTTTPADHKPLEHAETLMHVIQPAARTESPANLLPAAPVHLDSAVPLVPRLDEAYALYDRRDMLFMQRAKRRALRHRPYAGLSILHNVPLTMETLFKLEVLLAGGADLTVTSTTFMQPNPKAVEIVRAMDVRLQLEHRFDDMAFDVCLDVAGELYGKVEPRLGTVEITRTGSLRYRASTPTYPVIAVDDCRVKELETILGTGEGFVRSFIELTHESLTDKTVLVFGYGKVGKGIVRALRPHTDRVTIVDRETLACAEARRAGVRAIDAADTETVQAAAREAFVVVTATGRASVISGHYRADAFRGRYLANMGGEDEFGDEFCADEVLYDKRPVNFSSSRPTLMRYLDPVFHAHNLGIDLLRMGNLAPGVHPFPEFLAEDIVDQWEQRFGETIDG